MESHTLSKVDRLHAAKIACEIVLGTIGTFLVNMLCGFLLSKAPVSPNMVVGFLIIATEASLVVYLIGKLVKHRSSYLFTLLGSGLFMGIYIAILFTMDALDLCPS